MIKEGLTYGTCVKCTDTTIKDLEHFQQFITHHFTEHTKYEKMLPDTNQPAELYGTARTHKFENYDDIKMDNLKVRPIMDQSGTMVYSASQMIAEYLSPLAENKYVLKDCLSFPKILSENKKNDDEEDISYVIVSLFTNVPVNETINYILAQIYSKKRIKPICRKLIIKMIICKTNIWFLVYIQQQFVQTNKWLRYGKSSVSCPSKYLYGNIGEIRSRTRKANTLHTIC